MKENLRRMVNKAVVAGAMTLGLSGQADARTLRNIVSFEGEAQAGKSPVSREAFKKAREDYLAGKWVDASVISPQPLEEHEEAEYINKKYFLTIMKPSFFLGKGIVVESDSTQGFVTIDKTSKKVVYRDMLEVGNPEKPINDPKFQALVKNVLEQKGLPDSVLELFRGLLIK
jgi:hypothetical protein